MKRRLLGIFILALALRVLIIFLGVGFDKDLTFFDARDYDRHALNLLSGKGLTNGATWAGRPPLYPLFLAFVYRLFDHSYLMVRLIQSFLGAATIFLVYGVLRAYFSKKVCLWSAFLTACHPLLIVYAGNILSETLSQFFLALFLIVFLRGTKKMSSWGGGVLFGLLLLCRASLIFFLPFIFLHLLRDKKNSAAVFGFMVAMSLVLSPWGIRNYALLHRVVPLTTNGGSTFWDANNPESLQADQMGIASHWEMPGRVMKKEGSREILLSEVEGDRYLFKKGILFLRDLLKKNPLLFGYFFLRKALAAFSLHAGKSAVELSGCALLYLVFLPFGLWRSRYLEHRPTLLYGLLLQYLLSSLVFFGRAKYRIVIEPYLLAFIALGILECVEWLKKSANTSGATFIDK